VLCFVVFVCFLRCVFVCLVYVCTYVCFLLFFYICFLFVSLYVCMFVSLFVSFHVTTTVRLKRRSMDRLSETDIYFNFFSSHFNDKRILYVDTKKKFFLLHLVFLRWLMSAPKISGWSQITVKTTFKEFNTFCLDEINGWPDQIKMHPDETDNYENKVQQRSRFFVQFSF